MKKHAIALAALGLVSGYASAQSSVTLYGVVDVALERVKGATSVTRVTSGQQQGSRWGLRGTEDLGGGLKATFLLESGFNADVGTLGQGGRLFGRQGYVGLGGNWGTVRLGRQYTPMDDIASIIGTKVYDVVSVVPIIGNGDYNRVDNAITYVSPTVRQHRVPAAVQPG
ncbi:porin [Hydrogenophaga sp. UC242_50]|uniref:porin n=1 Tax=unclassified Hydrogenophaga TaxID=2610897 RepID=UPI0036D2D4FD